MRSPCSTSPSRFRDAAAARRPTSLRKRSTCSTRLHRHAPQKLAERIVAAYPRAARAVRPARRRSPIGCVFSRPERRGTRATRGVLLLPKIDSPAGAAAAAAMFDLCQRAAAWTSLLPRKCSFRERRVPLRQVTSSTFFSARVQSCRCCTTNLKLRPCTTQPQPCLQIPALLPPRDAEPLARLRLPRLLAGLALASRSPAARAWPPCRARRRSATTQRAAAARRQGHRISRAGEARHLPLHARRAVARRYLRLQAQAHRRHGQRPATRPGTKLLGSKWKFAQHGQERTLDFRALPECREACRRPLPAALDADRSARASAGVPANAHRLVSVRPARHSARGRFTASARENENLPGFVTLTPPAASGGAQNYGCCVSPRDLSRHTHRRAIIGRSPAPQIRNLHSPLRTEVQRAELDLLQTLNRETLRRDGSNPDVEGVIESYELAFRMQKRNAAGDGPLRRERGHKKAVWHRRRPSAMGVGKAQRTGAPMTSGRKCLLARRLVEAGVRFVEISHGDWDQHFNLTTALGANCRSVDQPIAGAAHRSQAARPAQGHAGDLGRRIWPHPARAGQRRARPQQQSLHDVDGRRRREGRLRPRPDRRLRLRSRREQSPRPRPPRDRSCTCSASTTRSSPTATPAATSGSRMWRGMW